jgi:thiamine-monophosphate kinase
MTINSEEAFLSMIDEYFAVDAPALALGRGDDCAVLHHGGPFCVSSDLFLEDIHFRRSYFSPRDIGYKALAVNVSDIAAMGGRPLAFTMDLMIPPGLDRPFWEEFFSGMAALARQNDMPLAGGDLSRSEKLGVSISIWGTPGPGGKFITRTGGNPGDVLFYCGELGLARAGLTVLEKHDPESSEGFRQSIQAHLRPKPKTMVATLLAAAGPSCLMDVSDGLAKDLPRLLGGKLGAEITISPNMIHDEVKLFAEQTQTSAEEIFMLGGEDYALLGTADPETFNTKIQTIPGVRNLGMTNNSGIVTVNGTPFTMSGFDHFEA